ncbi:MAG: glutamate-cysteine ligase family protein [Acidobacteriota bacterium]|nr:glutamate-cysteine ligase family protein [Acidobacteriota bacterium]MDQ7087406.1 glutamate-cysteine ligase family protein [Acidobacteriota bacterium]
MREPITRSCLLQHFSRGFRPHRHPLIGLEYELLGLLAETGEAAPYDGREESIVSVFDRLCRSYGWHPRGGEPVLELYRDGTRITLEPGSQFEISLRPHDTLEGVHRELAEILEEVRDVSRQVGLRFVPLGMQPLSTPEQIRIIPKERYRIMTRYLPTRGSMALWMMRATAGMQVNLDVDSADRAAEALRFALCLSSPVVALFANSPLAAGANSGWLSRRALTWTDTDPDRCGLPPALLAPAAGAESYLDWALDAGMFFIVRGDHLLDMTGVTFREYLAGGRAGMTPTIADWETHLTTLFPEARLKSYLELRCADSNQPELALGFAALAVGLFYGGEAVLDEARALLEGWSPAERLDFHLDCARRGLAATAPSGQSAGQIAGRLVALAARSLQAHRPDERAFLEPVEAIVARGAPPAREVLERWEGPWRGNPVALARDLEVRVTAPR